MKLAGLGLLALLVSAFGGSAGVHVTLAGKPPTLVAGKPWTARLAVRPASFRGDIRVNASGPGRRVRARARNRRVRLVFPSAGRWRLTASAGGSTSQLGSVLVRRARRPVIFSEPTSIYLEPAGTLLVVENNPGRLLDVDPKSGRVTVIASGLDRPYAAVRSPSGAVFASVDTSIVRFDPDGSHTTVHTAASQIGPLAASPSGDLFFTTADEVWRLSGGVLTPVASGFSNPHGLAVAGDGSLFVSDTGHDRIARVSGGVVSTFADIGEPFALDLAGDETVFVVAGQSSRVVHFAADATRIGLVGPVFDTPYDVAVAPGGVTYVLEAGSAGRIRRVAPDGTITTISR
jgi:sugar lactone lactonase YvrE